MKRHLIGTLLFVGVTFFVQTTSHFLVLKDHYDSVSFTRKEVIFPLAFLTLILQGIVLSFFFQLYSKGSYTLKNGFQFGLLMSALFVCYPAFTEPAKYSVPDIGTWVLVEGTVGLIQFCSFSTLLSFINKKLL